MNVPFFDYKYTFTSEEDDLLELIRDAGRRGAFIQQSDLEDFEHELARFIGSPFTVGVANATDGLMMALMAGGIGPGDEVIFCSHTMVATASAIHFTGATPVPVEAGSDHLMDVGSIEAAITPRTKVIMPTQLNGRTADMDTIGSIAREHGLQIYEDAAQALGSQFKNQMAGTFGEAACISFYPAKLLGCLGDGGAVLCRSKDIYTKLLLLRDHGRADAGGGDVELWGFNSRLDNIQAAVLSYRLKKIDSIIERRRQIARIYKKRLADLDELVLPPGPDGDDDHFDVFQNYEIEAQRRDALKDNLAQNSVGTLIQWGGKPVHQFKKLGFTDDLPVTDSLFKRMLMLPMNLSVRDEELEYICDLIHDFYRS